MDTPPPPGVSTIGPGSKAVETVEAPAAKVPTKKTPRSQPKPRNPGDDVLAHPEAGRRITQNAPVGVLSKDSDIIEMPMPHQRLPRTSTATFKSVDGNTYSFRTKDQKGKPLAYRNEMCLFVALTEMAKGGSPVPVFEAFKLSIDDATGRKYFPIPPEVLALVRPMQQESQTELEDEQASDFRLGD